MTLFGLQRHEEAPAAPARATALQRARGGLEQAREALRQNGP